VTVTSQKGGQVQPTLTLCVPRQPASSSTLPQLSNLLHLRTTNPLRGLSTSSRFLKVLPKKGGPELTNSTLRSCNKHSSIYGLMMGSSIPVSGLLLGQCYLYPTHSQQLLSRTSLEYQTCPPHCALSIHFLLSQQVNLTQHQSMSSTSHFQTSSQTQDDAPTSNSS